MAVQPRSDRPQDKKTCTCKVKKVDDKEASAKGWECKCHKVGNKMCCSFKGPNMKWGGQIDGGMDGGDSYAWVTDPDTGENFLIHYEYKCE